MRRIVAAALSTVALLGLAPAASADVFGPPTPFAVPGGPAALASGDFNRDGVTDLVTANNGALSASVLLGLPTGGYAAPIPVPVSALPVAVTVDDFNGDGDEDLAIAHGEFSIAIALGGPGGTFGTATDVPAVGVQRDIASGDLNGDGDPDLVVCSGAIARVLLGSTGSSFTLGPLLSIGTGSVSSLAIGDFDQDLAADVVFADPGGGSPPTLHIWRGDGNGAIGPDRDVGTPPTPRTLVPTDVNGDGDLDLVGGATGFVTVFHGGAGTTFPTRVTESVPGSSNSLAVTDVNGDEDFDIINGSDNGALALVLGGPADTLLPATTLNLGGPLTGLVAGRLNGDDRPDIAVTNQNANTVSVLPNTSVAAIETNPANLTFPTQARGTLSAARTVTVSSTGERPLHIRTVRTLGLARDSYVITGDGCSGETVAPGSTCTFAVRFAPENAGAHEADLHILSDATNPTFSMSLNGTGGALPAGATGPPGAPGKSGSATVRDRLAAAFATDRLSARAGKRVRMRFVSTMAGVATLELRRGSRVLARVSDAVAAGRNALSIKAPRKRGRYTLALTVTGGGQSVTDSARLTVKRRPT